MIKLFNITINTLYGHFCLIPFITLIFTQSADGFNSYFAMIAELSNLLIHYEANLC